MPSSNPAFEVPTVDVAPYMKDSTSQAAVAVVAQIRNACMTTGFFQLIGHGIKRDLQDDVFRGAAAVFSLPFEEKKRFDTRASVGSSHRGYEVISTQGLAEGTLPDLKEVYKE